VKQGGEAHNQSMHLQYCFNIGSDRPGLLNFVCVAGTSDKIWCARR